jgi:hypothetical protein
MSWKWHRIVQQDKARAKRKESLEKCKTDIKDLQRLKASKTKISQ